MPDIYRIKHQSVFGEFLHDRFAIDFLCRVEANGCTSPIRTFEVKMQAGFLNNIGNYLFTVITVPLEGKGDCRLFPFHR